MGKMSPTQLEDALRSQFLKSLEQQDKYVQEILLFGNGVENELLKTIIKKMVKFYQEKGLDLQGSQLTPAIIRSIDQVIADILDNKMLMAAGKFARNINKQFNSITNYYQIIWSESDQGGRYDDIRRSVKKNIYDRLGIGKDLSITKEGYLDRMVRVQELRDNIKNLVLNSYLGNVPLETFTRQLQGVIKGIGESGQLEEGWLVKYLRGFALDAYNKASRATHQGFSKRLGLQFFIYSGGLIEESRAFCIKRNGNVFHVSESDEWHLDPTLPRLVAEKRQGAGVVIDYVPLIDMGRWNCHHVPRYISDILAVRRRPEAKKFLTAEQIADLPPSVRDQTEPKVPAKEKPAKEAQVKKVEKAAEEKNREFWDLSGITDQTERNKLIDKMTKAQLKEFLEKNNYAGIVDVKDLTAEVLKASVKGMDRMFREWNLSGLWRFKGDKDNSRGGAMAMGMLMYINDENNREKFYREYTDSQFKLYEEGYEQEANFYRYKKTDTELSIKIFKTLQSQINKFSDDVWGKWDDPRFKYLQKIMMVADDGFKEIRNDLIGNWDYNTKEWNNQKKVPSEDAIWNKLKELADKMDDLTGEDLDDFRTLWEQWDDVGGVNKTLAINRLEDRIKNLGTFLKGYEGGITENAFRAKFRSYNFNPEQITSGDQWQIARDVTVMHEMAHAVHSQILGLSRNEKEPSAFLMQSRLTENGKAIPEITDLWTKWQGFYKKYALNFDINDPNAYIYTLSEYALYNPFEFFAENFTRYHYEPKRLPQEVRAFFDDLKHLSNTYKVDEHKMTEFLKLGTYDLNGLIHKNNKAAETSRWKDHYWSLDEFLKGNYNPYRYGQ